MHNARLALCITIASPLLADTALAQGRSPISRAGWTEVRNEAYDHHVTLQNAAGQTQRPTIRPTYKPSAGTSSTKPLDRNDPNNVGGFTHEVEVDLNQLNEAETQEALDGMSQEEKEEFIIGKLAATLAHELYHVRGVGGGTAAHTPGHIAIAYSSNRRNCERICELEAEANDPNTPEDRKKKLRARAKGYRDAAAKDKRRYGSGRSQDTATDVSSDNNNPQGDPTPDPWPAENPPPPQNAGSTDDPPKYGHQSDDTFIHFIPECEC